MPTYIGRESSDLGVPYTHGITDKVVFLGVRIGLQNIPGFEKVKFRCLKPSPQNRIFNKPFSAQCPEDNAPDSFSSSPLSGSGCWKWDEEPNVSGRRVLALESEALDLDPSFVTYSLYGIRLRCISFFIYDIGVGSGDGEG